MGSPHTQLMVKGFLRNIQEMPNPTWFLLSPYNIASNSIHKKPWSPSDQHSFFFKSLLRRNTHAGHFTHSCSDDSTEKAALKHREVQTFFYTICVIYEMLPRQYAFQQLQAQTDMCWKKHTHMKKRETRSRRELHHHSVFNSY